MDSSTLTFSNYLRIFEILPFGFSVFNSLYISFIGVALTLLSSWAGLGMSLLGKRRRLRLLILSAVLLIIPITAVWLTRFLLLAWIGVTYSRLSLLASADGIKSLVCAVILLDIPPHRATLMFKSTVGWREHFTDLVAHCSASCPPCTDGSGNVILPLLLE